MADAIVVGAGIVGVSTAIHLQRMGMDVTLVDRRVPGEETSAGNSGIIVREIFSPVTVPGDPWALAKVVFNQQMAVRYQPSFLLAILPWLARVRREMRAGGVDRFVGAMSQFARHAAGEHKELAGQAGTTGYYRDGGWLRVYRTAKSYEAAQELRHQARVQGVSYTVLEPGEIGEIEPDLRQDFFKAILFPETVTANNPEAVTKGFAAAFSNFGGTFATADAASLESDGEGAWSLQTSQGRIRAPQVVIALGPWSSDVLGRLGYRFPFAVARGYHLHLRAGGAARLRRPVVDVENGFVLSPMENGIRLTSGFEFAHRDAPPSPVQITAATFAARRLFPVADAIDPEPWMGSRPLLPDSLPMIGAAPRHAGLWINTGHGQYGFTLGPVSGRLLAEMMCKRRTIVDPQPFDPVRYDR